MRAASPDKDGQGSNQGLRLMLWPVLAAIVFGLIGFGELIEDGLRIARNSIRSHAVSGDIVLVEIDEKSLRKVGAWPWPRATQGRLVAEADRLGADQLFMDILYANPSDARNDQALADVLSRAGNVTIAAQSRIGEANGKQDAVMPLPAFAARSRQASIGVYYNRQGAAWKIPYADQVQGEVKPSLAAAMAGVEGELGE